MEAVGRLAGGIAHDFNNLLTAILGNAEFAARRTARRTTRADADVDEISERRRTRARDADAPAARVQPEAGPGAAACSTSATSSARLTPMLRRLIGEDDRARGRRWATRRRVRADRVQLEQVLMNLAVNARDAMPSGGRLTIETADVDAGRRYAATPSPACAGRVRDARRERHRARHGRGRRASGSSSRSSRPRPRARAPGSAWPPSTASSTRAADTSWSTASRASARRSSCICPCTDEAEDVAEPESIDWRSLRGVETILFVEDEEVVREFVFKVLTRQGYTGARLGSAETRALVRGGAPRSDRSAF